MSWSSAANWVGDIAPVTGDDLVFGTPAAATNNNFAAGTIFNSVAFNSAAFTLGGNGITLGTPTPFGATGSGNITSTATGLETISLGVLLGAGTHTIAGGTGGLAFNVAGGTLKPVGGGGSAIFSGTVNSNTITNFGTTGILGGYATVGTNWATHNGTGIVAYSAYTGVAPGGVIGDDANSNVKITAAGDPTTLANVGGTTNINSLIFDPNTAQVVGIAAGDTLRLGRFGGIFKTGTTNNIALTVGNAGGSLTAGGNAIDVAGEIVLNGGAGTSTGTQMIVAANIVDNGTGAVTLVKTGRGYASVTGTGNAYTGGTFVNEGRLQAGTAGMLGTGAVTIQAGGEVFLGGGPWTNNFFIAGAGPQNENGNGAIRGGTHTGTITMFGDAGIAGGTTLNGRVTGGFNLQLGSTVNVGGTGSTVQLGNVNANNTAGGNDWTGNTTIVGRTGATAGQTTVRLNQAEQIPNGATAGNLQFGASGQTVSTSTFDLNGFNETINGLSVANGTATLMTVTSNNAAMLTVGDNNATASYGGNLTGGGLSLTKIGTGTQTLTGANLSYSGVTTVNAGVLAIGPGGVLGTTQSTVNTGGTLLVNATGTVSGDVIVNSGGVLRGTGTAAGAVTVNAGGALAGGNGTLTLSGFSVDMNGGSALNIALNSTASQAAIDSQSFGALKFNGGNASVGVNVSGSATAGSNYTLVKYNSLGAGDFNSLFLASQPNRTVGNLVNNVGNSSFDYHVTSVDSARWSGAASNQWSTATLAAPKNWVFNSNGTTQTDYLQGDVVQFTDSATTTTPDISVADVAPSGVDFNHSLKNYTLTGTKGITGETGLSKSGTGTLTIANPNSYSGVTAINGGVVSISASNNIGNGSSTNTLAIAGGTLRSTGAAVDLGASRGVAIGAGGATIDVTGANALTVSGVVSAAGSDSLTKIGTGTLTVSGTNTYTGVTNVNAGTVKVVSAAALGDVAAAADVNVAAGAAVDLGSAATGAINFGSKNIKIAGNGSGTGALTNSGQNTQLNAFNFITLTADATIGGYRMDLGRGGLNGVLNLAGRKLTLAMTPNAVGTPQPMFSILTPNAGSTTAITGNGTIEVASGTLSFEVNSQALASDVTSITFKSGANLQSFRQIGGRITVPMIFEGNNIIGGGTNTGTVAQIDSPMTLKGNVNLQGLASGAVPATPANNPIILAGNISESGGSFGLSAIGINTTTLTGANSYSGTTTINSGATIQIGGVQGDAATPLAEGPTGTLGSGPVSNNGSLVFNRDNSSVYAVGNAISGTGAVTNRGTGTVALGGTNSYQGATTVTAGTLRVNGSHTGGGAYTVAAGATLGGTGTISLAAAANMTVAGNLAPGASAGTLTVNLASAAEQLDLSGATALDLGNLQFELGSLGASDKVVLGTGTLNIGTLDFADFTFTNLGGMTNGVYTLFDAPSAITGSIGNAAGTIGALGATLSINGTNDVVLTVTGGPPPVNNSDFNDSGLVDGIDFLTWQRGFGLTGQTGKTNGNANADTVIDGADLTVWKNHFGGPGASAVSGAVPEPTACVLLAMGGLGAIALRRRGARG